MASPELKVKVLADLKGFNAGMKNLSSKLKAVGSEVNRVGKNLSVGLTLPLATAGAGAIKLASDVEESLNKVNVAFGDSASEVTQFANTTLKNFGIARGSALEMTALFGDMSTAMGFTEQEASNMSMQLTGLAGDLASFKNISVERAQTALAGVFTGETEALKGLGIIVTETALEQEAMNQGIEKSIKEMTQQEKIALRLSAVMSQTANAQGDFARTSEGTANQLRIFQESMKQLGEDFGRFLLPSITKVASTASKVIGRLSSLSDRAKGIILGVGVALASIGPIALTLGATMTGLATAFAILSSPITAIVVGIAGLVIAFDYVRRNLEAFQADFVARFNILKLKVLTIVRDMIQGMAGVFDRFGIDILGGAMDGINDMIDDTADKIASTADSPELQSFSEYWKSVGGDVEGLIGKFLMLDNVAKQAGQSVDPTTRGGVGGQRLDGAEGGDAPRFRAVQEDDVALVPQMTERMQALQQITGLARQAFMQFGQAVANSLTQAIMQGKKFGDVLKNLLKQLASQALQKFLTIALTGGAGGVLGKIGGGIFGKGGGLFGKIGGALFGGAKMATGGIVPRGFPNDTYPALLTSGEMVVPKPHALPSMGGAVEVFGEFRVRGSDLVTAISNTNNRTLR